MIECFILQGDFQLEKMLALIDIYVLLVNLRNILKTNKFQIFIRIHEILSWSLPGLTQQILQRFNRTDKSGSGSGTGKLFFK